MIQGLDKLLEQFDNISNLDLSDAINGALQIIADASSSNAPVDTGDLRDSHEVVDGELIISAPYSLDVEFGTIHMAAQPYLRPAIDSTQSQVLSLLAAAVQSQIKDEI